MVLKLKLQIPFKQSHATIFLFAAPELHAQTILQEASTLIRAKYNFYEMTLQVEEFMEEIIENKNSGKNQTEITNPLEPLQ